MLLAILIGFISGVLWGLVGVAYRWPPFIAAIIAGLTSFFICLGASRADDTIAFVRLRQTTVMVNGARCSGSGSLVKSASGRTLILTNEHVCNCARYKGSIYATLEGGELLKGSVVKQSWKDDLCAAEIDTKREGLRVGPRLLPLSHIHTRGYGMGRLTESSGKVVGGVHWSAFFSIDELGECPKGSHAEHGANDNVIGCVLEFTSTLSDLYARPGASGSPVVNDDGELVGVISSWHQDRDKYDAGFVPYAAVRDFVGSL